MTTSVPTSEQLIQISLLGEAIDHAHMAVFVFAEDGRYAAVNEYACELLGYTRAELLARRLGDLSALPRDEAVEGYASAVEAAAPEGVARVRTKDGDELALRFHARPTRVAGMTFYVAIAWRSD
jgi:PAS domain S-box-containing protein